MYLLIDWSNHKLGKSHRAHTCCQQVETGETLPQNLVETKNTIRTITSKKSDQSLDSERSLPCLLQFRTVQLLICSALIFLVAQTGPLSSQSSHYNQSSIHCFVFANRLRPATTPLSKMLFFL